MTFSLASLLSGWFAPLSRVVCLEGINIERLRDAPAEWSRQFEAFGLNPQQ
jgi:site-specific DNA recombinase